MAKQLNVNLAFTADTSQAAAQVRSLQQQLTSLINQPVGLGQKLTVDIQQATAAAAELKGHLQNATNVKTGTLDFGKLNQSLKASGTSLTQYATKLQSLGPQGQQAFMQLARSVASAEVPLRRSNALLSQFGTTLANTARWQLSSSLLHGFVSALSTAWNYSQDLNESLNNIRIVTGKNMDEMSKFADQANRAARALSTTTTEYTNASLIYYQQGLTDAEVLGRTETTIKMANASRQSAEVVSDQMTAIWNNFYDGSKSLEYYADVVTALGAATASSSEEIATGLEKFAAVAETVGLSYEYATSALATITATTRQSADVVGTALKTLFARLSDLKLGETLDDGTTLGQYSDNLAKIGVNIKDASGDLKDMDTILNETAAKWDNLSKAQQTALAKGVAGIRQYTQFIALMDNWDFMEENLNTANKATGTLDKQAKIYEESWEAASKRVKASLESIYESVMDDKFFIKLTNGFATFTDGIGTFIKGIGGLRGVLSGLGWVLTKVFAEQMTQGFQNLTYNIQMATQAGREYVQAQKIEQVQEFVNSMKTFGSVDGDPTGVGNTMKQVYTEELTMQQELMQNADRLTEAEQQKLQSLIEQHRVMGDQSIAMAQQLEQSRDLAATLKIELMGNGINFWGNKEFNTISSEFTRLGNQAEGIGKISAHLKSLGQNADITQDQVEALTTEFQEISLGTPRIVALVSSLEGVNGASSEAKAIIEEINVEMQKVITSATNTLAAMAGVDKTSEGYTRLRQKVEQYVLSCRDAGNKQELLNILLGNGSKMADDFGNHIYGAGQKVQTTAQLLSTFVSGLMSAGMLVSSINGLIDAISNPDLSGWEKFGQILTSVSMITFSLTGAWKGLTAIIEVGKRAITTDTIAVHANGWAKELAAKETEKLTAKEQWNAFWTKLRTKHTKESTVETAEDAAMIALKEKALAAQNEEEKEAILLEMARKKMGLSRSNSGKRYYQNDANGFRQEISKERYDELTQEGLDSIDLGDGKKGKTKISKDALKTIGKKVGGFVVVAAAIAAAAFAIKTASDYYHKADIQAQKATETAAALSSAYEDLKGKESEFRSGLDSYEDAVKGLDELTKGTEEYKEAVAKANEEALALLQTNQDLKYTVDKETGLIIIDETDRLKAERESLAKERMAWAAMMQGQTDANTARVEADKVDFTRNTSKSGGDGKLSQEDGAILGGAGGAAAALGAGGAILLSGAIANSWNPVGWVMLAVAAAVAITGGIMAATNNDTEQAENDALNAIAEAQAQNGGASLTKEQIAEIANKYDKSGKLAKSLSDNAQATNEMAAEIRKNIEAIERNSDLIMQQILQDNGYINGSKFATEINDLAGDAYTDSYNKWINSDSVKQWGTWGISQANGANAEAKKVWSEYLKYAGLEGDKYQLVDTKGNDMNRIFVYLDEQGNRVEKTLAEMQKTKATYLATHDATIIANQLVPYLKDLTSKGGEANNAMASFAMNKDFLGITKIQYDAMTKELNTKAYGYGTDIEQYLIDKFGDLKTATNKLAYDSVDEMVNAFSTGLGAISTAWGDIKIDGLNEEIFNKTKMSTLQAMENLIEMMNTSGLGENAGLIFVDGINRMLENIDPEKTAEVMEKIVQVDWKQWNAGEEVIDIIKQYTDNLNMSEEELASWVDMMRVANSALYDYEAVLTRIKEIAEITKDLSIGDIISEENLEKLRLFNSELLRYFDLLGTGEARLIGDILDFQQAVNKETVDQKIEAIDATALAMTVGQDRANTDKNVRAAVGADASTTTTQARSQLLGGEKGAWVETEKAYEESYSTWWDQMGYMIALSYAQGSYTPTLAEHGKRTVDAKYGIDNNIYNSQLEFLKAEGVDVSDWDVEEGARTEDLAIQMANKVQEILEARPELTEKEAAQLENNKLTTQIDVALSVDKERREELLADKTLSYQAVNAAEMQEATEEKWEDMDPTEVENYAKVLQESLGLTGDYAEEAAEDVALYTMKMNKGIDKLANGFEDWNDILINSEDTSEEYATAMTAIKDAMSDLLGVNEEFLSNDFITEHLSLIREAANGSAEAIDALAKAASKQILINMGFAEGSEPMALHDQLSAEIDGMEVGATLEFNVDADTTKFDDAANQLVQTAGMTVDEAQAYFNSLGYEPEFVMTNVTETAPMYGKKVYSDPPELGTIEYTAKDPYGYDVPVTYPYVKSVVTHEEQVYMGEQEQNFVVPAMSPDGKGPIIKSLTKKTSGKMNNYSSSNKGGKAPGGKSGGGSKKSKKKSDEVERYHVINKELEHLKHQYDAISKARERAFGADKLKYLKQEADLLREQVAVQQKYVDEIATNYNKDKSAIAAYGAVFNEDGIITNYDELVGKYVDMFNSGKIDEDAYNAFKNSLSQYEETWKKWFDENLNLKDLQNQVFDKELEGITYKLELKTNIANDQLEWLEYQLENIEDAAYDAAEALSTLSQKATSILSKVDSTKTAIGDMLAQHGITDVEAFMANPDQWDDYDFTENEINSLRTWRSDLINANKDLIALKDDGINQVIGAFDEWNNKMDKNIKKIDHYSAITDSFKNIIDIVGKDILGISDEAMASLTQASVSMATSKLEASKSKVEALQKAEADTRAKLANATSETEREMLEKTLEHIEEQTDAAEEEMMGNWEAALQAAADAFDQAVESTISSFEKAMAGTFGSLEELQNGFDQATEISERYVADYKEIYELSKLNRDISRSMDETDNIKAKRALRDLQKEINDLQNKNVQMSQYDLDHLRAKYELRLAEIALEEAQDAKSQVRMRRDSEGNYSYVFTADQNKIDEAQQNYEDKLYEMQELNSEYIKEMQNNILQSEVELANALRELDRTKFASDEEYYAKVNELTAYYTGQRNYYLDEANKGITNNQELVNQAWANYSASTGYKMSADKDYVDNFNETTYAQLAGYQTIQDAQARFATATTQMVNSLNSAFSSWRTSTESIMQTAGTSIEKFGETIDKTINGDGEDNPGIVSASDAAAKAVAGIKTEMDTTFSEQTLNSLSEFATNYAKNIQPVIDANKTLIETLGSIIEKQSQLDLSTDQNQKPPEGGGTGGGSNSNQENPYGKASDSGSSLQSIQWALQQLGYDLGSYGADGIRGSYTTNAIKAFQEKAKSEGHYTGAVDGVEGPLTRKALAAYGYKTGGIVDYTGLAWLDGTPSKPEYVLNAQQTSGFLRLINLLESNYLGELQSTAVLTGLAIERISHMIDLNAGAQSLGLGALDANNRIDNNQVLEQTVTIHAEFPNAVNHSEIEEAFDTLINRASQFANRKKL